MRSIRRADRLADTRGRALCAFALQQGLRMMGCGNQCSFPDRASRTVVETASIYAPGQESLGRRYRKPGNNLPASPLQRNCLKPTPEASDRAHLEAHLVRTKSRRPAGKGTQAHIAIMHVHR
jgi:hypothetical protein